MLNFCGEDDWTKIQPIVKKCASPALKPSFNLSPVPGFVVLGGTCRFSDYRAGDVVDVCTMIRRLLSSNLCSVAEFAWELCFKLALLPCCAQAEERDVG